MRALLCSAAAFAAPTMTGYEYTIANPVPGAKYEHRGEFFEVTSKPWTSHYAEVAWPITGETMRFPPEIVQRFDGKVMVVTGSEWDVVRVSENGTTTQVPCNEQYVHHYSAWMRGKMAKLQGMMKVERGHMDGHAVMPTYVVDPAASKNPHVQVYSEGNGNEARAAFKHYPEGYGLNIESPQDFLTIPMIINTNKRLTGDTSPGPINHDLLPANAERPQDFSGIIECPCTDRIEKVVDSYVQGAVGARCDYPVETELECSRAAASLSPPGAAAPGGAATAEADFTRPAGCYSSEGGGLRFNTAGLYNRTNAVPCAGGLTCVCRDPKANSGTIDGVRFKPEVCAGFPESELRLPQYNYGHVNGVCDIKGYEGGMLCCNSGNILLDKHQTVPAATDTFHIKYRFYFEEYTGQENAFRIWWSLGGPNDIEYTIPKSTADCLDPRTPVAQCEHRLTSHFRGIDLFTPNGTDAHPDVEAGSCMARGDYNGCANLTRIRAEHGGWFQLLYAAPHCHGPACKRIELWNQDSGELLCALEPIYGTGSEPVNEKGYLVAIPPCIWGYEPGLQRPPRISLDTNLTAVKWANSTHSHTGVMGLWQMRAGYLSAPRRGPVGMYV